MTNIELQFAAHQIGMVRASKRNAFADWREHQVATKELRGKVGEVYQVYPYPNRALVKALADSLREGLITRADFAACLQNVMGRHRL